MYQNVCTVYYSVFSVLNDLVSHKSCYMFQKISQHVNNCLFCTDALISPERHASFKTTGLYNPFKKPMFLKIHHARGQKQDFTSS